MEPQLITGWKDYLEVTEKFLTIFAILAGAVWGYLKYFRGRTFRPRLETEVTASIFSIHQSTYLLITASLKNVGLSKVPIDQQGSDIELYTHNPVICAPRVQLVDWDHLATISIFKNHEWIEPNEHIKEQKLIELPGVRELAIQVFSSYRFNEYPMGSNDGYSNDIGEQNPETDRAYG